MNTPLEYRIHKAIIAELREDGLMIVPRSPTGSMAKHAQRLVAPDLTTEQIENIYFAMTNAWVNCIQYPVDATEAPHTAETSEAITHHKDG